MVFPTVTWVLLVTGFVSVWAQNYFDERIGGKRSRAKLLSASSLSSNGPNHNGQGTVGETIPFNNCSLKLI